jgi:hypothetical protein
MLKQMWGVKSDNVELERHVLAFSIFCAVAMTFGYSWITGRNFSCKSQMLAEY